MDYEQLRTQFERDPWPIVGFTTTEHNTLTGMRSATIAESSARMSAFLTTLSAALVSLGFVSSASGGFGRSFFGFGAVVLGASSVVGLLTFVRCVQSSIEDLRLLFRIERVRAMYVSLAPGLIGGLDPPVVGDVNDLRRGHEMAAGNWTQLLLTMAGFVGVINAAVVGATAGFVVHLAFEESAVSWSVAVAAGLVAATAHVVAQMRTMQAALIPSQPSPGP